MKIGKSLIWIGFLLLLTGCRPDAVDIYNHPINISDFKGKWVVIQYWTTWCDLCIQEIPTLNNLAKYYKNNVVVLGVNPDHLDDHTLINLSQSYQVNYLFLRDFPIQKWGGKVEELPTTFILDKKGRLYKTLKGPVSLDNFRKMMNLPSINYD